MSGGRAQAELYARLRQRSGFADGALGEERLRMLLSSRAAELRLADAEEAARLALGDAVEYARIEAHFAPPETWLFRYRESFELMRAVAGARALGRLPMRVLVLGAGGWCEPIGVVCALRSAGAAALVRAVDRNPRVFAVSARGPRFAGIDLRGGLPAWAETAFVREGDALVATPGMHDAIATEVGDVLETLRAIATRGERFDIVLFRNVAIYMGDETRRAVLAAIPPVLADDGLLLVGHAEMSAAADGTGLEPHPAQGAFALRARVAVAPSPSPYPSVSPSVSPAPAPKPAAKPAPRTEAVPIERVKPEPVSVPASVPASVPLARLLAEVAARPTDASLQARLALALAEQGDRTGALEAAMRALYLDRHHEEALLLAARISTERGAHADAERFRNRALRAHLERERGTRDA